MKVDLNRMFVDNEIKEAVMGVLESGRYVKGPLAKEMENAFTDLVGARYAISCSSGSTALMLAFQALCIGAGDQVILPSHTFIASLNGFYHYGARPVFVDIDPETFTLDPELVEEAITEDTKAILPVHLYGHPANMGPLMDIAEDNEVALIGDAAQAHGARCANQDIGSMGDMTCYSFFPSKIVTVAGEGGMITCNDEELYLLLDALKNHGRYQGERDVSSIPGFNFRMPEILAAAGNVQLKHMEDWIERRRTIAARYTKELDGIGDLVTPEEKDWGRHVYYLYVIRTRKRDDLSDFLKKKGINTGVHYRVPVHKMPYIKESFDLPVTEKVVDEILSIPMHPLLEEDEQTLIIDSIREFF